PPTERTDLPHLQGFNPQDSPTFEGFPELEVLIRQFRDPTSDGGDNWVDLRPYDPSLIPTLNESRNPQRLTGIAFMNLTQAEVFLYEMGRDGTEYFWRSIPPSPLWLHVTPAKTNVIWLIKDPNGKPLAVFQSVKQMGRAIIRTEMALITPGLSKYAGDNQSGVPGAVLGNPFVIEVRDENGTALEGISITFAVVKGGGNLNLTDTMTDENGRAESSFTLGLNLGTNTVSVSAVGVENTVTFNAIAEAAVDIPDPNLRAAITTILGKAPGAPITRSGMATLTRLEAPEAGIHDLTGLEHATNLVNLGVVWGSSVSDLSPLAGLTKLTGLYLGGSSASDLSPLAGLTNLEHLFLDANGVSDLSPLAGLTNLARLAFNGNSISDLSALRDLTNLSWMRLAENNISDLSPLVANTGFGSGDEVDVRGNPLSYLSIHVHIPALQSRGVGVQFDAGVTRPPDVNGDGVINVLDLIFITESFGTAKGDLNGDGVTDVLDLTLVSQAFGIE
ncbi:MAG: hypothetical protein OXT74_13860, partial [Candidatus Poribacteria bacterium]|nr:hypothetical protein [Candidatus Poribacteria bacterium]